MPVAMVAASLCGRAPRAQRDDNDMKNTYWLAGLLALAATAADAGAWTPKKDRSYNKFAFNDYSANQFYGATTPGFEEFNDVGVSYYGEYGYRDDLALFTSIPLKFLRRKDNGGSIRNGGIGDIDLGARYRLLLRPFALSTALLFKVPYLYRGDEPLALGNGQEDFEWRWLIGKTFGVLGYGGVEAAYRRRLGAPSDELRYLIEYGIDISSEYYLRGKFDGLQGLGNSDSGAAAPGNPALNLEFDLARLDLTAGWRGSREWAWEFTYGLPVYGRNTLRGETIQVALIYTP